MKFTEEKAREVVDRFSLDEKTIAVWRHRGKIPDKYAKLEPEKTGTISGNADKIIAQRIIDILKSEDINRATIKNLSGVLNLHDIVAKKSTFTESGLISVKKEINRLKIDVVKSVNSERLLSKLLSDKRIKYYSILRYSMSDDEIKRIAYQAKKSTIDKNLLLKAKDAFAVFALKLNM